MYYPFMEEGRDLSYTNQAIKTLEKQHQEIKQVSKDK